jgi:DNA-binding XRE family transcriptional regulator
MKGFGKKILQLRTKHGETQECLAMAIGVTPAAIGNYEIEMRVPRDSIKMRIAKHYGVSVDEIFFNQKVHE